MNTRIITTLTAGLAAALALGACSTEAGGSSSGDSVTIGIVNHYTGPLANYGPSWEEGFRAGLDVATDGTNQVGDVKVSIKVKNDNSDPTTALAAAKELLGENTRIIAGPTSSAVVAPLAQLVMENDAILIAGAPGTTDVDGIGRGVYRTAPTTPQLNNTILAAASADGDSSMTYIGQDYAFGQSALKSLRELGSEKNVSVDGVLLPTDTKDFTAGVTKALAQKPDALFVGWVGEGSPQLFKALDDQGAFDKTHVITTGPTRPQFDSFAASLGDNLDKAELITYYAEDTMDNDAERAMDKALADLKLTTPIDHQQAEGYLGALMVVKAIEDAGPDLSVDDVNDALSDATFETPIGSITIRPEDHTLLTPLFGYEMVKSSDGYRLKLLKTYAADDVVAKPTRTIK